MSPSANAPEAHPGASVVMVVDHEVLVRMAIAGYLRECRLKVIEAADAAEAVTVFRAGTPVDVVVAEAQLPGEMDGFALARWIREHHGEVRVILASSTARKAETAGELCEEGPMLAKPYDTGEVEHRIGLLIGRRRPRRRPDPDAGARAEPVVVM
jgi:DNA-binding response OmpR family regulator